MIPKFHFSISSELVDNLAKHNSIEGNEKFSIEQFLPTRSDPEATGYDVRCAVLGGVILSPDTYIMVPLGFRMMAPAGWWLQLNPRSSTFAKKHIHALYGVIDETFERELLFAGQYIPNSNELLNDAHPKRIEFGERIGQLIPVRRESMEVSMISSEEMDRLFAIRKGSRGTGGFGSTGKI